MAGRRDNYIWFLALGKFDNESALFIAHGYGRIKQSIDVFDGFRAVIDGKLVDKPLNRIRIQIADLYLPDLLIIIFQAGTIGANGGR